MTKLLVATAIVIAHWAATLWFKGNVKRAQQQQPRGR